MMKRLVFRTILGVILTGIGATFSYSQVEFSDVCHVYVVDTAKAIKLDELEFESEIPKTDVKLLKLKKETEIVFSEFKTKIGEEELTTKHYTFPNSKLIITASVYYTDESMFSQKSNGKFMSESILMGISVTGKREISAIGFPPVNNAVTEVTYNDQTDLIRVKKYVKVQRRTYLVGLECNLSAKKQNNKKLEKE